MMQRDDAGRRGGGVPPGSVCRVELTIKTARRPAATSAAIDSRTRASDGFATGDSAY